MLDSVVRPNQRAADVRRLGAARAAQSIRPLTPGCRVVGVTKGQFSLLDMIEAVLDEIGPSRVLVATWTPGAAEMERVCLLLESGLVAGFRLLVDRSFPSRHPQYVQRVTAICGAEAIRMTRTHAKFALLAGGDYRITIRTSMNFNANPRLEQFDLDDDPVIYGLFAQVAEELYEAVPRGLHAPARDVEAGFGALLEGDARGVARGGGLSAGGWTRLPTAKRRWGR